MPGANITYGQNKNTPLSRDGGRRGDTSGRDTLMVGPHAHAPRRLALSYIFSAVCLALSLSLSPSSLLLTSMYKLIQVLGPFDHWCSLGIKPNAFAVLTLSLFLSCMN